MPTVARDVPVLIYELSLVKEATYYHDYKDGNGLVKTKTMTYQYEFDSKQNLAKMDCYCNGVKQTEILFTWEEIPWP
ncbi:MAG: hypothetical protein J7578_20730 [Chitinophagaceae bacterium]|nr:hypothetical protein [Chitinophagaceae bacterium]